MTVEVFLSVVLHLLVLFSVEDSNALTPKQIVPFPKARVSFYGAREYCERRGMRVVRIENRADNAIVHRIARSKKIAHYWADGSVIDYHSWINTDGVTLQYFNWARGRPNNLRRYDARCVNIDRYGYWGDDNCLQKSGLICERTRGPVTTTTTSPVSTPAPQPAGFNKSQVVITDKKGTFDDAQEYCYSREMKVIRLNNEAEKNLVIKLTTAHRKDFWFWIDGRSIEENKWVNSDDEPLTYFNWNPVVESSWGCIQSYFRGQWLARRCGNPYHFVCLKGNVTTSNVVTQGMTTQVSVNVTGVLGR